MPVSSDMKSMTTLYVLDCGSNKRYVGTTSDLHATPRNHFAGLESEWTQKYQPVGLIERRIVSGPHVAYNVTKNLMKKYGIQNVRGSVYRSVELTDAQILHLTKEIHCDPTTCATCGQQGRITEDHACDVVTPYSREIYS